MFPVFFLIFVIVPIIEIYFLIKVGSIIGSGWTILAVVATAMIGSWLIKGQGVKAMNNFQRSIGQGKLPAQTIFDGVCLFIAGAFLLTPGFVTDTFGFLLLTPPFRVILFKYFAARKNIHIYTSVPRNGNANTNENANPNRTSQDKEGNIVIDADADDYHEIKNKNRPE